MLHCILDTSLEHVRAGAYLHFDAASIVTADGNIEEHDGVAVRETWDGTDSGHFPVKSQVPRAPPFARHGAASAQEADYSSFFI